MKKTILIATLCFVTLFAVACQSEGNSNTPVQPAATPPASTAPNTTASPASSPVAAAPAAAQPFKLAAAGVEMTLPEGFTSADEKGQTIVTTPDGSVSTRFIASAGLYETANSSAAKQLALYVKDAKVVETATKGTANGLEHTLSGGTGLSLKDSKPVAWDMAVLNVPNKPLVVITYGDAESLKKHDAALGQLIRSIKKS